MPKQAAERPFNNPFMNVQSAAVIFSPPPFDMGVEIIHRGVDPSVMPWPFWWPATPRQYFRRASFKSNSIRYLSSGAFPHHIHKTRGLVVLDHNHPGNLPWLKCRSSPPARALARRGYGKDKADRLISFSRHNETSSPFSVNRFSSKVWRL